LIKILYLAAGGAIGTVARYTLASLFTSFPVASLFPWGTFIVNLSGSFLIGIIGGLATLHSHYPDYKLFIVAGLLGGFTTFSSLAFECFDLLKSGHPFLAVTYVLATNVIGILLAFAGYSIANQLN
jgi:CrcB protein